MYATRLLDLALDLATARTQVDQAVSVIVDSSKGEPDALEDALTVAELSSDDPAPGLDRHDYQLGIAFLELALHDVTHGLRRIHAETG